MTEVNTTPSPDLDKLPARLSPSRANDYLTCPKLFYYKTIEALPSPPTIATMRGNLVHSVCELMFDNPPGARTAEKVPGYLRQVWAQMSTGDGSERADAAAQQYRQLAPEGSQAETDLLASAQTLALNWLGLETVDAADPLHVVLPDGSEVDGREIHLSATVAGVSLHGFVDRLDHWRNDAGDSHWSITDYKTGKVPHDRYLGKYWFQLRVYSLLAEHMFGIRPTVLRLVFLTATERQEGVKVLPVSESLQQATARQVGALWKNIQTSARTGQWDTTTGPLCNWCHFQPICPAWNPGTDELDVG